MRRVVGTFAVAVLSALCVLGGIARADEKAEEGFTSLFNGKDLTGWRYPGMKGEPMDGKTETPDGRFRVGDGILIAAEKDRSGKGGIKDLYTTKPFDHDFRLRLEFRAAPRADSGVYLRGRQLQVRDYPTVGPYKNLKQFKDGDWNELEIAVKGTSAECKCNGEVLEAAFKIPEKGAIGLQAEAGKFEFRRVRVKELP